MTEQQNAHAIDSSILNGKHWEKFEFHKSRLERNIAHIEEKIETKRATSVALGDNANARVQGVYQGIIASYERGLRLSKGQLEFIRPANDADVAYRKRVYDELPGKIRDSIPANSPLRFHGSPIDRSRDIIASKAISSSVDREGISTSFDGGGGFSVTMPDKTETTIHDFTDILRDSCTVPAGCIFVLLPESEEDAEAGKRQIMGNVDFGEEPDRLVGIMTSPENLQKVRDWCGLSGFDPSLVGEFFEKVDEIASDHTTVLHKFSVISGRHEA